MARWQWVVILIIALAALSVGCGTARIDLKTDVLPSGEVDQEMVITADGMIGESLKEGFKTEEARKEGWTAELRSQGNGYVMRMAKRLKQGEAWLPPSDSTSAAGGTSSQTKVDFQVNDGLLDKDYRLEITMPPSAQPTPPAGQSESDKAMSQLGEQMAKSMFKMSWTINLPGEVVETNADSPTKTGGTWEIGFDRMQQGVEMKLVSRERKTAPLVIGGIATALAVVAVVAVVLMSRRRPKPSVDTSADPSGS